MAVLMKQYAVTGSAVSLTDANILNITNAQGTYAKELSIKSAKGAVNLAYVGKSTVTAVPANAGHEIDANQTFKIADYSAHGIRLDELYVIGTANAANILFITVVT